MLGRWVIVLTVAVGVAIALAIAGIPGGGSGSSDLPVLTDTTSTTFSLDAAPTTPPRATVPGLSTTTTFAR